MSSSSWPRLLVLEQAGFLPCDPWNGYLGIDPLTVGNLTLSDLAFGSKFPHCPDGIFSHILYHFIYNFLATKSEKTKKVGKKSHRQLRKLIGNWLVFPGPLLALLFRMIGGSTRGFGHLRSCPVGKGRAGWCWLDAWPMGGSSRDVWDGCPEAVF